MSLARAVSNRSTLPPSPSLGAHRPRLSRYPRNTSSGILPLIRQWGNTEKPGTAALWGALTRSPLAKSQRQPKFGLGFTAGRRVRFGVDESADQFRGSCTRIGTIAARYRRDFEINTNNP